jgi:dephospho-CoA kinase
MPLVWVTGNSGTGKSAVCEMSRGRGCVAVDADDGVLRHRLATRTTNTFGRHPEELAATLEWNPRLRAIHESYGATNIDASAPLSVVVDGVLAAVQRWTGDVPRR